MRTWVLKVFELNAPRKSMKVLRVTSIVRTCICDYENDGILRNGFYIIISYFPCEIIKRGPGRRTGARGLPHSLYTRIH